jgi:hypothetical protein
LFEKKPFSVSTLKQYSQKNYCLSPVVTISRQVASPNLHNSMFSPVKTIAKSPVIKRKLQDAKHSSIEDLQFDVDNNKDNNTFKSSTFLSKFQKKNTGSVNSKNSNPNSFKNNSINSNKNSFNNKDSFKIYNVIVSANKSGFNGSGEANDSEQYHAQVSRKQRNVFKNLEHIESQISPKNKDVDLPFTDVVKFSVKDCEITESNIILGKLKSIQEEEDSDLISEIKHEGFLIKVSENKTILKRWYKLINKDFYCKYFL